MYYPFNEDVSLAENLGANTWRLYFVDHFTGWDHGIIETSIGLATFDGPANEDTVPNVVNAKVCDDEDDES